MSLGLFKHKEAHDTGVVMLPSGGKVHEDILHVAHEDITSCSSKPAFAWHLQPAWKQTFNSIRETKLLFTLLLF